MIKGLRGATTWSEDLNNLLPFYRDLLGLPIAIQIPGFVVLGKLGAATLALGFGGHETFLDRHDSAGAAAHDAVGIRAGGDDESDGRRDGQGGALGACHRRKD